MNITAFSEVNWNNQITGKEALINGKRNKSLHIPCQLISKCPTPLEKSDPLTKQTFCTLTFYLEFHRKRHFLVLVLPIVSQGEQYNTVKILYWKCLKGKPRHNKILKNILDQTTIHETGSKLQGFWWMHPGNTGREAFNRSDPEVQKRKYFTGYSYIGILFGLSCWKVPSYIIRSLLGISNWWNLSSAFPLGF